MNLVQIYRCLCDETRLRILHLLKQGPLCVCHFQDILQLPQVAVSKHLAYLRRTGMVEARRHEQWMIYSLPASPGRELDLQLRCLQDCVQTEPVFRADLRRLKAFGAEVQLDSPGARSPVRCEEGGQQSLPFRPVCRMKPDGSDSLHRQLVPEPPGGGHPARGGGRFDRRAERRIETGGLRASAGAYA